MEDQKEKLLLWLARHDLISILRLERKLKIPANTVSLALRRLKPLPDRHLPKLIEELKKYGFKINIQES